MSIPILKQGATGEQVRKLQTAINKRGGSREFPPVAVDGELGPVTWAAWRDVALALGALRFGGSKTAAERRWVVVVTPDKRTRWELARAASWRKKRAASAAKASTLRERAWAEGGKLVGVSEQGGNNRGPEVERIIKGGGGKVGDAWCGWFNAFCYLLAGSKAVTWRWGAVRLYLPGTGMRRTSNPLRGMIVRYDFDHTGMFGGWRKVVAGRYVACPRSEATHILAREGNTGDSGAVSDSKTGKDGVKEKYRPTTQVRDFVEVLQ